MEWREAQAGKSCREGVCGFASSHGGRLPELSSVPGAALLFSLGVHTLRETNDNASRQFPDKIESLVSVRLSHIVVPHPWKQ